MTENLLVTGVNYKKTVILKTILKRDFLVKHIVLIISLVTTVFFC